MSDNTRAVWFRDDIANIMLALTATASVVSDSEFRTGYAAGLIALATAIGVEDEIIATIRDYCTKVERR